MNETDGAETGRLTEPAAWPEPSGRPPVPPASERSGLSLEELRAVAANPLPVRGKRHPGQWIATIVILWLAAALIRDFAVNKQLGWADAGHYLFSDAILQGVLVTIEYGVISQIIATVIGFLLAAMQQSDNPVLTRIAWLYVYVFRSTPLLVQILFWYNLALVFPTLSVGIPFTPLHIQGSTNTLITPFLASILALGLHEAGYMAEIVRAGILAVPRGQVDAALSIGMTRRRAMRRIVLPQTLRVVVPPTGNLFIGLLKASALVSVIGGNDLLTRAQQIYSVNFKVIALLIVASVWYLVLVSVASIGQHYLEARLDRDHLGGDRRDPGATGLAARLRKNLAFGGFSSGAMEKL